MISSKYDGLVMMYFFRVMGGWAIWAMWAIWALWAIWGEWGLVSVSCEPLFRVELGALFTQLELQDIVFSHGS